MFKIDLQLFANIDEVIEANKEKFEGVDIKGNFNAINTKLSELGYDVLINHKEKAEFVPSARLSAVVSQRDDFKAKIETLNTQLEAIKGQAGNSAELNTKIQTLMNENNNLLKEMEKSKVNTNIIMEAIDAHDPKAIIPFVNMDNVKVTAKGEVVGAKEEIERLRREMPYMFKTGVTPKAGTDNSSLNDKISTASMNAMIRRAAGRSF